jgi:RNA recognition motif-containing protein
MGRNLYIGNLAYGATAEDLRELFGGVGQVDSVDVISDRETGRSRGFAFVKMVTQEDATRAIDALNGRPFMNRVLVVDEAKPRGDGAPGRPDPGAAGGPEATGR